MAGSLLAAVFLFGHGSLAAASTSRLPDFPVVRPYDLSAYELAPELQHHLQPWTVSDLKRTVRERVAFEKRRHQLDVDYYRIGYRVAFPLQIRSRPTAQELPAGISGMVYPWLIWMSWELEERWRLLHFAWRQQGDREAGRLLQQELAALVGWDHYCELNGQVGLVTGHLAAVLALALRDKSSWEPSAWQSVRTAAENMIERDVWPWFIKQWPEKELAAGDLVNIPAIALVRSAELARVIESPRRAALEARARTVLRTWCRCRVGPEHHTEGTAYDGYLLDSVTEWIAGLPDQDLVLRECAPAFRNQAEHWIQMTLPGRLDLHAPLGDVEAEMEFWATVLTRFADWYSWPDATWLVCRFPLSRFRAAALIAASAHKSLVNDTGRPPAPGLREHPNALSLRTGWAPSDLLAVVGLSRGKMGHLHADGGQLILGWQGRFWITDPGYQQYRPGLERDYTLGPEAHNVPMIGSATQIWRAAKVVLQDTNALDAWRAVVDSTQCYRGLPEGASVRREVDLTRRDGLGIVVCDQFRGFGTNTQVSTSWQIGYQIACAFRDGWARLSDGRRVLWMGSHPGAARAGQLSRHPGSRGPLTLTCKHELANGAGDCWWVFWCDPNGGWTPPTVQLEGGQLRLVKP